MPWYPENNRQYIEHFNCPECGNDSIEEVCRAIQYTMIGAFYKGHEDYFDTQTEGTDVTRYQCYECGHTVCDGLPQPSLYLYLKTRGMIKGVDASDPLPEWEL